MTTDIHVNSKPAGNTWMRLTVHLNGPSVQFADPKKEFKEVNGKRIKKKRVQLLCKAVSPTDAEARSTELYLDATFAWEILSIVGTRIEAVLEGDR